MASKLKEAKSMRSTSVTMTDRVKEQKSVPEGATIISKTVRTETEEIENGWLISKNFDITYKTKGATSNDYAYYTKKWYSKTDPLDIKLTDKSLADEYDAGE
jgi:IS1 family transposase